MPTIQLPNRWKPRDYQLKAWSYLESGGRHAELVWHRRSGKDDIALHWAAVAAFERRANYWHMLPLASQARKAIWHAVSPHTGIRRIDEAFPPALRKKTLENEMLIEFKNGSTWQLLGSDNYNSAIGSTPAGITYSEWALANPTARGYLRPIITEAAGWQLFITTPRGRNHAYRTYNAAKQDPNSFAQLLNVNHTGLLSEDYQQAELAEYISTYGEDMGRSLFEQEYLCSFEAAILGAVYGREIANARAEGRIIEVPHDPDYAVNVAMDIGRTDDTSIWFYQVIGGEIRVLETLSEALKDPDWVASQLIGREVEINIIGGEIQVDYGDLVPEAAHRQAYTYGEIAVPHDAKAKTFVAKGKSVMEQLLTVFGPKLITVVPDIGLQDGIQSARRALARCVFDEKGAQIGIDALGSYRYGWSMESRTFSVKPIHDWSSNLSDGFRYLAVQWQQAPDKPLPKETAPKVRPIDRGFALDDLWDDRPRGATVGNMRL